MGGWTPTRFGEVDMAIWKPWVTGHPRSTPCEFKYKVRRRLKQPLTVLLMWSCMVTLASTIRLRFWTAKESGILYFPTHTVSTKTFSRLALDPHKMTSVFSASIWSTYRYVTMVAGSATWLCASKMVIDVTLLLNKCSCLWRWCQQLKTFDNFDVWQCACMPVLTRGHIESLM